MNLSPNAYELLQRLRRAYVEAGEDGWCRDSYWEDDGERCCLVGRAARIEGCSNFSDAVMFHAHSPMWSELKWAAAGLGYQLVHTNDELGFVATCALLDQMLAKCQPVEGGVSENLREAYVAG